MSYSQFIRRVEGDPVAQQQYEQEQARRTRERQLIRELRRLNLIHGTITFVVPQPIDLTELFGQLPQSVDRAIMGGRNTAGKP